MTQAIILESFGGPQALTLTDIPLPDPGPNEVQIKHSVIEVNFIDTYQRQGIYPLKNSSKIPGVSAVGRIVKVGSEVGGYQVDDLVAYTSSFSGGAYCEARNINAQLIVAIPPEVNIKTIGTCFFKGLTAHFLACRTFIARPGCSVLIHAAAGGVGRLLAQWCNSLGAQVIGTVGSEEKREIALAHGCHQVINYTTEDWVPKVLELTNQVGVNAVYDGVGLDTFYKSLDCLMRMGTMVLFGASSGPIGNVDTQLLASKSLFFTRPSITHYKSNRMELILAFEELCSRIIDGSIKVTPPIEFKLADAAAAHKLIESRKNLSSVVLIP